MTSVRRLLARLRAGDLTAEGAVGSYLSRIDRLEPRLRAWARVAGEQALERARRIDAARRRGEDPGPLAGLPVGIKDVIETAGLGTGMGSPVFDGYVPGRSAAVVGMLEAAGAIVLGKTVTTEFATQHPGPTRNPWNPAHTPGGSSSGSAAAVAAGMVPAAVGTQTRASTIRPAAYCGIVGYKPTLGAIPTDGVFALSHTLDHVGLMAADVDGVALLARACVAGPEATAAPAGGPAAAPAAMAAVRTPFWPRMDPVQATNFQGAVARLQAAGAAVEWVDLPPAFDAAQEVITRIQLREIADRYGPRIGQWGSRVSQAFRRYVSAGLEVSRQEYDDALARRGSLIDAYVDFCREFPIILTPPATGPAPAGLAFTGDASPCLIWTLCGAPSITVPSGLDPAGLPLGLQIVAAPGRDAGAIEAALWCEHRLGRLPPACAG